MGIGLIGVRPGVLVHGHGGEPLLLWKLCPIGAVSTIAVTTRGVATACRWLVAMAGVALLVAARPSVIPHLGIDGGPIAVAIDVQASLGGRDILRGWLIHNVPLAINLDIDSPVQVGSLQSGDGICITGITGIAGVGMAIIAAVLADPLGTGQTGVAGALHTDRSRFEIGQGISPRPVMAADTVSVGR